MSDARHKESYRRLVAPVDGAVQGLKIHTSGAVVTTADTLMTIVPDGTGIEAIGKLRETFGGDLPALLITADRSPDVRAEAEKYGIGLQQKPVRPAALRAYLAQVSSLKRAAAQ